MLMTRAIRKVPPDGNQQYCRNNDEDGQSSRLHASRQDDIGTGPVVPSGAGMQSTALPILVIVAANTCWLSIWRDFPE